MTTLYERLTSSVFRDDAAALSQALNDGAQLDWPNDRGLTALHQCVWLQRYELIALLVTKHNANVDEVAGKPGFECTALETAVSMNAGGVVEVLLANGADVHRTNMHDHSAMDIAAHYNRAEMVELLLRHGASAKTKAKTQPIVHAVKWKSMMMFMLLLKHGASIETKDRSGLPLLHLAIRVGAHEIWSWLIDQRRLLDATDRNGNTPLHAAAEANAVEAAKRLLRKKASKCAKNKDDRMPLDVAVLHDAQDVARLLQENNGVQFDQLNTMISDSSAAASPTTVDSTLRLHAASASSAASLQVIRPTRVVTYATMRILMAKSLRSVLVMGTQSPFCSWTLRHTATTTTTVLARGQTSRHHHGGKQADWTSESFPLSTADLKSKDRHSVSLMECSLEFEVKTPTAVPATTKSIGTGTLAMSLLSTQAPAGSRTEHSVSLSLKGADAGELLVELLY